MTKSKTRDSTPPLNTSANSVTAVDPIFAAIDSHLAAIAELDRQVELFKAGTSGGSTLDTRGMCRAGKMVVDTSPTTAAGLKALSDHLGKHFGCGSGFSIHRPLPGELGL
jgi:hypothetical protein